MIKRFFVAVVLIFSLVSAGSSLAQGVDYAPLAAVLKTFVNNGQVNYPGLKAHSMDLDAALSRLSAQRPDTLPDDQRKAYYINAYNAWTLKLVISHYPVASIRKIGPLLGTPWQVTFIRLNNTHVSLEYIEHDILRGTFNDPRIHFALNCASKSCPPLASEPYLPETLDEQLDQATAAFLNSPQGVVLEGNVLNVSALFDWYKKDFGGEEGVREFILRYVSPQLAESIKAVPQLVIKYLPYDWALNAS